MIVATKSTIKTIENQYGFDVDELVAELVDYGYTLGRAYGCYVMIDENGEAIDYGHPVMVKRNGTKYGGVIWCERESLICCGGEYFTTVFDEIDTNAAF